MTTATSPMTTEQMLTRAARAVRKVDVYGERGCTMVTFEEVEAMAVMLRAMGMPPLAPGKTLHLPANTLPSLPPMEIRK